MNQTFTMSRWYRLQGILFLVFFSLAALVGAYPLVHSDPQGYGYRNRQDEVRLSLACLALFGTMAMMSILMLIYHRRVQLCISDTALDVRYLLRSKHVLLTDISSFDWYAGLTRDIHIKGPNQKTTIHLKNFSRRDQLVIVRALRRVLPPGCQTHWPVFCHAVALPLRDGISSRDRLASVTDAQSDWFLLTRSRYDRQAVVLMPMAFAIAALLWWRMHWPQTMLLPAAAALWWQVCRWTTPKDGRTEPRLIRSPAGRFILLMFGWMLAACVMIPIIHWLGLSVDAAMWTGLGLLLPIFPIMFVFAHRSDQRQKRERELGSTTAEGVWDRGEIAQVP
jgi:hypothetical protein